MSNPLKRNSSTFVLFKKFDKDKKHNYKSISIHHRSQNEQLRAEIEAESIAHKAQINAVEMRAHDSWLAAKQAERRLEEAKSEASVLRKKLTNLTTGAGN